VLDAAALGRGGAAGPMTTVEGYRDWAEAYDRPGNALARA
jgi:hypothetical protein